MEIVVNCVTQPKEWLQIPLPLNKDLSVGTPFERALNHAGHELTRIAGSQKDVTSWIRGNVLIVSESDGLKLLPQGPTSDFELMAKIEGVLEKCFAADLILGESRWVECKTKTRSI